LPYGTENGGIHKITNSSSHIKEILMVEERQNDANDFIANIVNAVNLF